MIDSEPRKKNILLVDDEPHIIRLFQRLAEDERFNITGASNVREAIATLEKQQFHLIISDLALPSVSGLEFLKYAQVKFPTIPFIIVTGYASIESAREAIQEGAFHYITKPFQINELKIYINKALEYGQMHMELEHLKKIHADKQIPGEIAIVGNNHIVRELIAFSNRVAPTNANVLILGESGTGKELFARSIHYNSHLRNKQFIPINCAGIPESLLESELFGHTKGAFTGAIRDRKGLFEEADGGTMFLDEIGELSLNVQTKLLRVIEEKTIKPLGTNESRKVDVRLIFATNRNLTKAIEERKFREDLYYRIAVVSINLIPLRERRDDIPLLAHHFLEHYSKKNNKSILKISENALSLFMEYEWSGNVRELQNVIESATILCDGNTVEMTHLPSKLRYQKLNFFPWLHADALKNNPEGFSLKLVIDNAEREAIESALSVTNGSKTETANILKISRTTLFEKMKKHKLQ